MTLWQELGLPDDMLNFNAKLCDLQQQLKQEAPRAKPIISLKKAQALMKEEKPLLAEGFEVDKEVFTRFFNAFLELLYEMRPQISGELDKISKQVGASLWENLLKGISNNETDLNDIIAETGVNRDILRFIIKNALSPFIHSAAENLNKYIDHDKWGKRFCPVCGENAGFAYLEAKTGKRHLVCVRCSTRWPFQRLVCPNCGSNERQRYFSLPNQSSYQVHVCDQCKLYLKTLVMEHIQEDRDFFRHDLETFALDLLARKEGYLQASHLA